MATLSPTEPTQACEDVLRARKARNIELHIWPSENVVIDHMLNRRIELTDAYAEIHAKLHDRPHGIDTIFDVLGGVAVLWNPDRVADARDARSRLEDINDEIATKASQLAELLEERSDLHNTSGFASRTMSHIGDMMDAASAENGHYQYYLKDELKALRYRFDYKYWPTLPEILGEVAKDATDASPEATDPMTRAATTGSRGSKADFFKALYASMKEHDVRNHGFLPCGFTLSDNSLASLANCALDLGPDELVDGAYVKRLRQRERDARKSDS